MATRKSRIVIAFVLMLSLVSFFSIPASVFAEDPTVDANTITITHTVTYHGNGSDVENPPTDANSPYFWDASVTVLPPGDLTRTGYTFIAWNTARDGDGHTYYPNNKFDMPWENVNLYAQWEPIPGLAITKEVDKTTVSSMDANVHYTFTITNTGTYNLTNIKLNDPKLDITDLEIPNLAVGADPYTTTVAFNLGNLGTAEYGSWDGNVFTNTASVTAKYGEIRKDNISADCVDPGKTIGPISSSATVTYIEPEPGLTFLKTVDKTTVSSMDAEVNYTFTITNTGGYDLSNITINDELLNIQDLEIPDLDVGDPPYTTTVAVDLGDISSEEWQDNVLTNIAYVDAGYDEDGTIGPIESSAIVTYIPEEPIKVPSISLDKSVTPSDVSSRSADVVYTFVVTNTGNEPLYSVSITDPALNLIIDFPGMLATSGVESTFTTERAFSLSNLGTAGYGNWDGDTFLNTATVTAYTQSSFPQDSATFDEFGQMVSATDTAIVTYSSYTPTRHHTPTPTPTPTPVVVPEQPAPAASAVIPAVPVLDEPVPAAPLPKTGGLDPSFLYGLGLLLTGSGIALKRRK